MQQRHCVGLTAESGFATSSLARQVAIGRSIAGWKRTKPYMHMVGHMIPAAARPQPHQNDCISGTLIPASEACGPEVPLCMLVVVQLVIEKDAKGRTTGTCEQISRSVKTTHYKLQNNSQTRTVPKLYLDHTAGMKRGVICDLHHGAQPEGRTRYCLQLEPGQERIFCVKEEAQYTCTLSGSAATSYFLEHNKDNPVVTEEVRKG